MFGIVLTRRRSARGGAQRRRRPAVAEHHCSTSRSGRTCASRAHQSAARPSSIRRQVEDRIMGRKRNAASKPRAAVDGSNACASARRRGRTRRQCKRRRALAGAAARAARAPAIRVRGRRALLVLHRLHEVRLHQRQPAVRQSDLDARLARIDGPQRRGVRPARPHSVRRVRQGHGRRRRPSSTAISTTGISWSRSSSSPTPRAMSATAT